MKSHKDLEVWKMSMSLVKDVYLCTESFPKHEMYGLTSQLRRSSVSIPSNIAEGAARQTKKEFVQFLYYALGSSSELETQLELASMLNYIDSDKLQTLLEMRNQVSRMIFGLIRKWKL